MKMEIHLQQRLEQRQQLSQQMLQNLELLQLPILQLRQKIDEELEGNPTLELGAEIEEPGEPAAPVETAEPAESSEEGKQEFLEAVEDEWLQSERLYPRSRGGESDDSKFEFLQNVSASPLSLHEYLRAQLALLEVDPDLRVYLELLIEHLNDNGYLGTPLEEIVQAAPEEMRKLPPELLLKKFETALVFLQKMEPLGIGARTPRECLLLQLDESDSNYAAKRRLIERHLEDIGNNRLPKMARDITADPEALADFGYKPGADPEIILEDIKILIGEIQKLNPHPGANFSTESNPRVYPEVIIRPIDGKFEIVIEDSYLPPLSINRTYQEMLKDKSLGKPERDYLRRKLDAGRKLISAIEQRRHTIRRITEEILRHQLDFFERGAEYLKPLKMQEVADAVGIHVSTVSRAISGKWIETPRGIFPMKFFFASAAPRSAGQAPSFIGGEAPPQDDRTRLALMEKLREIIDAEDKRRPLADLEIVKLLRQQGLAAARRTVAKYREEMGIPSSRLRKQY
ncbi:MAG: RNA polymerase factor sigma-54 [Planctomycetes bacterium]|nr:RNA polymerase factor sigma-54 [Planctomycetota bacterium]